MESLIRANIFFLDQAQRLLANMDDQVYATQSGKVFGASLGQHLRHCLDHYASFLGGLSLMKIDYDHRERDEKLETSTEYASGLMRGLKNDLLELNDRDAASEVLVKMDCGGGDQGWYQSTLGRELQFLVSHTVHHFAMMTGMCQERGLAVERGFGIAPSTLRHRQLAKID